MQSKQLDAYLNTLAQRLTALTQFQREEEILEVRQHLEALAQWHIQQGKSEEEAIGLAIQQFGRAERIGNDLNKIPAQKRIAKNTANVGKYFCFWLGIAAVQFVFFTSMNDKPTDFPFKIEDRLLLAAIFALPALSLGQLYRKLVKKPA